MLISRRQIVIGAVGIAVLPGEAFGLKQQREFFNHVITTKGITPATGADKRLVPEVLKHISATDYVQAMKDLADINSKPGVPKPSTGEAWNQRWSKYANPLLVQIWNDMGYPFKHDCTAWCGVTLGWCLKRCGITPPPDCASSQSYLNYGTVVIDPKPGDICVFTNKGDASHGHVTIFLEAQPAAKAVEVVGANQAFSGQTNCPSGVSVNVVDRRSMALDTSYHKLNRFVRPKL